MYSKTLICLFVLISVIGFQAVHSQNCEERQNDAENLLRTLLRLDYTHGKDRSIATDEGFAEYCRKAKEGLILYRAYGKCLHGISKQIFSIIKSTATKALRNYCVINPEVSKEYLSCFADRKLTNNYKKCLFKFGEHMHYASESENEEEIFSSLCCTFNSLSHCLDETFQSNGACTNPKLNLRAYSKTLFKNLFGSVSDAFCSAYNEEVCRPRMEEMLSTSSENKLTVNNFSIVKSLITMSEKLSS